MTHKIQSMPSHKGPSLINLHDPPVMHLRTTAFTYALWWIVLLLLHAINIVYYIGAMMVYRTINGTFVSYELGAYSIGIDPSKYKQVWTVHYIMAGLHAFFLCGMLVGSFQAKRLVFQSTIMTSMITQSVHLWQWMIRRCGVRPSNRTSSQISSFHSSLFSRDGLFGVDYLYFDHFHLARELLETILQLIQAY